LTWATKTQAEGASVKDGTVPPLQIAQRDCDDDDDEIEIIEESPGTRMKLARPQAQRALQFPGNTRMAPKTPQPPEVTPVVEIKPLPKQQQEEAAKMAARRERFEARQRATSEMPERIPATVQRTSPLVGFGLNGDSNVPQNMGCAVLPGGVVDDMELLVLENDKIRASQHSSHSEASTRSGQDVGCFDDDDEALMLEILESSPACA
jgi:hypothetical protein